MKRLDELKAWYTSLQQRERVALVVCATFVALTLVYTAVLHPFLSSKHALQADVERQQALLTWMRPAAAQIQSLRGQQPSTLPANQSLLAVVDKSASDAGFGSALKQVQTNSDGSVQVQMQAAGFDDLMRWLGTLNRQYGISVKELTAQRSTGPGDVDASLSLQAPGS